MNKNITARGVYKNLDESPYRVGNYKFSSAKKKEIFKNRVVATHVKARGLLDKLYKCTGVYYRIPSLMDDIENNTYKNMKR